MAGSPAYKVFNPSGEYVAACKHPEDAAALVALYGTGSAIKYGHGKAVWREGKEAIPAGESYDVVASTVRERVKLIHFDSYARAYGKPHAQDPRNGAA